MTPDPITALADELSGFPIGTGYYRTSIGYSDCREITELIIAALCADHTTADEPSRAALDTWRASRGTT